MVTHVFNVFLKKLEKKMLTTYIFYGIVLIESEVKKIMYKNIKREYTLTDVQLIVYNSDTESLERMNVTLIGKHSSKEKVLKQCKKYVDSNSTIVSVEIVDAKKEIRKMSVEDFYTNSIKIEEEI